MLDNMADTVLLHNSIVCKLPDAAPFLEGINPLRISHCLTDLPNCSRFGIKANCIAGLLFNSNLFFVNPDASDFHLQPCSPAVDAGSNALAAGLLTDFDGGPRVRAGAIDLGPYEHDLGFVPTAIVPASCPDARDGSVVFGGSSCPPVLILWVKGDEFGSGTDSLAPGVYVFSFTDAAGHTAMETVVIPAPPGLSLLPNVAPPLCVGLNNGVAGVDIGGGTPPYQIDWGGGNTGNFLFSVPAGTYPVTVTDSRGCLTSAAIEVPAPGMVEVFYTVTPASAPQQANGSIQIDSVWGCTGPFQWNAPTLTNLSPGTYAVTVTDPCGCVQVFPIVVGIAVAAGEVGSGAPAVWLSPNPAPAGGTSVLRWTGAAPETLSVYDMAGRALRRMAAPPGVGQLEVQAPEAAGVYRLVVRGAGWQGVLRWVVW
ncbi:MAG: SprB repeat-containing protein [Saprospirales bacterium]|nr:SprB repeat-containing protein [Saprospirales bacterium]